MGASIPGGLDISAPTLRGGGRRGGPGKVPKVAAGASGDSHTKTQAGKEAEKDREREKIQTSPAWPLGERPSTPNAPRVWD